MSDQTVRETGFKTDADYENEIARLFAEIDRMDERILRSQDETRRSRERTLRMLGELQGK